MGAVTVSKPFRIVRTLFVVGYAIRLLLEVAPGYKRNGELFSSFQLIPQLAAYRDGRAPFILFVLLYLGAVFIIYRAFKSPKTWVFITGSVVALLWSLIFFSDPYESLRVRMIGGYIAAALTLPSCFVRPPAKITV